LTETVAAPTVESAGRSRRAFAGRAVSIAIAIALPILLWPPLSRPLDSSFDSAWRWAVNQAAARDLTPGALPVGPLSGLVESRAVAGGGLAAAAVFQVAYRTIWVFGLFGIARRRPSGWRWAAAALLFLGATVICSRWPDYDLVLLVLVLLAPWLMGGESDRIRWLLAGLLTGVAPFLKLSAGLEAIALIGVAWLARGVLGNGRPTTAFSHLAGGFVAAASISAVVAFDSLATFFGWLSLIGESLGSYGSALSLDLPGWRGPVAASAPAFLVCVMVGWAFWRRASSRWFWLTVLVPTLAALKHGIVRPDVHALASPWWAAGVFCVAAVLGSNRREAMVAFSLGLAVLASAAPWSHEILRPRLGRLGTLATGFDGGRNLAGTIGYRAREKALRRSARGRLRDDRRPLGIAGRAAERGVDVVPWRLTVLAANGLEAAWVPSPSFQFFHATTDRLADRLAGHFAGPSAPFFLLAHFDPIAGRQPLWQAPRAWKEIAARYAVRDRRGDLLVLRRRLRERVWSRRVVDEIELAWWEWSDLPEVKEGETLSIEIDLKLDWKGRLRTRLYRAEPVWIDVDGPGGRHRWRLLPVFGHRGLALGGAPADLEGLEDWLRGRPSRTVERIRLQSKDADRYQPVNAKWVAERLVGSPRPVP
jgi:hypothetical protein